MDAINRFCPRSGKPVSSGSLTTYKGVVVGFCNTGCRDDFEKNSVNLIADKNYFDALLRGENIEENITNAND